MTQQQEHIPWTEEQHAAYEIGMQTEREHQHALARLVMRKHAEQLTVAAPERDELRAEVQRLQAMIDNAAPDAAKE